MTNLTEIFGSLSFNDAAMKERLPKDVYTALKKNIEEGSSLCLEAANVIANAMKDWALEKGATHFTHWFQPLNGITAEKHDSFISPTADGRAIAEFSGKELIKGEPDASSFPTGGLRATFEARGYTAWDPTSYAFIKDGILCIPSVFCSYGGEALDKKTPLMRSMEALNKEALRLLHLLGLTEVKKITTTVGPEQEYFLIDKALYEKRRDLIYTGRTLFGAKPPKGQEMEDHYFGTIKPRISAFMKDLNVELWKLGVVAKTEHNEVAPSQHELAPIYSTTNIATDHNQLTMEVMKKVADRHHLACLLHEKPFAGVNGSGKHNNWSLATDTGLNLLEPGKKPETNLIFLLFLTAVIKAVDDYQDLLRISVANSGNDHRLGANEAPPAIISIFLGDELTAIMEALACGNPYTAKATGQMETGVTVVPNFAKDTADRNRTSPFAFTGNKFEFRMVGSSFSIAGPNIMLNTMVAEALAQFADALASAEDVYAAAYELAAQTYKAHKRIVFNGNNYSDEWVEEASRRGLLNLQTTADAIAYYTSAKNVELFNKHKIFSSEELFSRSEVMYENYCKILHIEALTMLDMAKKDIMPAAARYMHALSETALSKKALLNDINCDMEEGLLARLAALSGSLYKKTEALNASLLGVKNHEATSQQLALYYKDAIFGAMQELRAVADEIETLTAKDYWPYPTYGDLLFSV